MIEPSDEDIAEALRLMGYPTHRLRDVREHAHAGMKWAQNILAHARTLAKLRIAVEAMQQALDAPLIDHSDKSRSASGILRAALAQIKDTPHAD